MRWGLRFFLLMSLLAPATPPATFAQAATSDCPMCGAVCRCSMACATHKRGLKPAVKTCGAATCSLRSAPTGIDVANRAWATKPPMSLSERLGRNESFLSDLALIGDAVLNPRTPSDVVVPPPRPIP